MNAAIGLINIVRKQFLGLVVLRRDAYEKLAARLNKISRRDKPFEEHLDAITSTQLPAVLYQKSLVHTLPCVLVLPFKFAIEGLDEQAVSFPLGKDFRVL